MSLNMGKHIQLKNKGRKLLPYSKSESSEVPNHGSGKRLTFGNISSCLFLKNLSFLPICRLFPLQFTEDAILNRLSCVKTLHFLHGWMKYIHPLIIIIPYFWFCKVFRFHSLELLLDPHLLALLLHPHLLALLLHPLWSVFEALTALQRSQFLHQIKEHLNSMFIILKHIKKFLTFQVQHIN